MTLLLTEADVRSLLTMPIALEIVEESLRQQGNGELILNPRRRIKTPDNAPTALHGGGRSGPGIHRHEDLHGRARRRAFCRAALPIHNRRNGSAD